MAKTIIPSSSSDGATVYPVFVDTNLDTHLALIVSDTDTVSDLKMKIKLEHPRCFPKIGKVKVNALQVKRRGHFYHLSDSMLVKVAFAGAKRSWYVYVDASSSKQHIGKPNSGYQLALPWGTEDRYVTGNHQRTVDSDSNKRSDLEVQKNDAGSDGIVSKKRLRDMQCDSSMERASESGPAARKKRNMERNESNNFEKDKVLIYGTTDVTSKVDATNQEMFRLEQRESKNTTPDGLFVGALDDDHLNIISINENKKTYKKKIKGNIISVEPLKQLASVVPRVQEGGEKRAFKENSEDIHNHSDTVAVAVIPEQDTQQGPLSKPSRSSKKEKRKELVEEAYDRIKVPFSTINSSKHEEDEKEVLPTDVIKELHDLKKDGNHSAQNNLGSDDQVDICERSREVLLSHDPDVKLPERHERVFRGEKDMGNKEPLPTSKLSVPKGAVESENTVIGKRKKRKTKKSSTRNENESVLKDENEGANCVSISGPGPAFDGHLIDGARKDGSILSHDKGKEIPEKKTADSEKVISSEPEFSLPMETSKSQRNADNLSEKSRKKLDNLGDSKRRKNSAKRSAAENEIQSVVKHDNDPPHTKEKEGNFLLRANSKEISDKKSIEESHMTGREMSARTNSEKISEKISIEESHITARGEGDNLLESGAELLLQTETNGGKLNNEDVIEASKECENTNGTKRKKKKVKKSVARHEDAPIMKLGTDAVIEPTSAVPNPALDGHLIEKPQKNECVSFQMEKAGQPEEKAVDAPHRGSDDVISRETETLRSSKINRGQETVKENLRSSKKKSQVDKNQEYAPRMDEGIDKVTREVTGAAKSKTSGLEQSFGDLETERSNCIEHVSSLLQKDLKDVCLSEVPSLPVIENILEADTGHQVNVCNGVGEGEQIDFKQYFVPGENHNEGTPTNKVKEPRKSERLKKSKKNKEKVDVPSVETLHSQQKSLLSPNNHGNETSQTKNLTQPRKPLPVVENKEIVNSSKKSPEVSIHEMKAPNSHIIDQIKTPKMDRQSGNRNNGSLVGSSSKSESSVRFNKRDLSLEQSDMDVGKTATKITGEVVNNSQRMKSLLATPGAIFGDDSSNSSADDNGHVDSNASTRTPSDKSVSSEVEGESDSSLDSGRNGSNIVKGKGRRSFLVDSQSSDMKNKSFGEILRSSSRFKKAKLTATQYQEIAENIDFVPDSQPVS